jgi:hypothetical protein
MEPSKHYDVSFYGTNLTNRNYHIAKYYVSSIIDPYAR